MKIDGRKKTVGKDECDNYQITMEIKQFKQ